MYIFLFNRLFTNDISIWHILGYLNQVVVGMFWFDSKGKLSRRKPFISNNLLGIWAAQKMCFNLFDHSHSGKRVPLVQRDLLKSNARGRFRPRSDRGNSRIRCICGKDLVSRREIWIHIRFIRIVRVWY